MKKIISVILAALMAFSVFTAAVSAVNEEQVTVTADNISDFMIAQGEYFFPSSVDFSDSGDVFVDAKVVCFAGDKVDLPAFESLSDAVVIINNSAEKKNGSDSKFDIAVSGCKNWFAYDVLSVFGKTVLAFYYDPEFNADYPGCYDKLVESVNPDYIYFDSLNKKTGSFYVDSGSSLADIIDGKANLNPGFPVKIMVKIYRNFIDFPDAKREFEKNPGLNAFAAIIRSLFKKK